MPISIPLPPTEHQHTPNQNKHKQSTRLCLMAVHFFLGIEQRMADDDDDDTAEGGSGGGGKGALLRQAHKTEVCGWVGFDVGAVAFCDMHRFRSVMHVVPWVGPAECGMSFPMVRYHTCMCTAIYTGEHAPALAQDESAGTGHQAAGGCVY